MDLKAAVARELVNMLEAIAGLFCKARRVFETDWGSGDYEIISEDVYDH